MKILYGVVGEGMGHAIRSRVILSHLRAQGHRVKVVVSGRAYAFLSKHFDDVVEIRGFPLLYDDNALDRDATAFHILSRAAAWTLDNIDAYVRDVRAFDADAVISDFDSFSHLYAIRHQRPILSIDNQHAIPFLQHDEDVIVRRDAEGHGIADYRTDFDLARRVIRTKMLGCDHYLVTTFFRPPIKPKYQAKTTLIPPILRDEILAAKAQQRRGDHVLVYQTSASYTSMLDVLSGIDAEFRVYGFLRPDAPPPKGTAEGDDVRYSKNVLLKRFSEDGFIHDLANSRAVFAGGGFTLLGEAIYLGKPIYSVPIHKHFEQIISARYLEKLGIGEHHDDFSDDPIRSFLARSDAYAAQLTRYVQNGNEETLAAVDTQLARMTT